jgi:hypothetical protein
MENNKRDEERDRQTDAGRKRHIERYRDRDIER